MTDPTQDLSATPRKKRKRGGSKRQMTFWRGVGYRIAVWLAAAFLELLWFTCRIRFVGEARLQQVMDEYGAVIPVCWHQHLLLCARWAVAKHVKGMKIGFLISPSLDGEAPSMLARVYGAQVIRGSSTHTGPQAMRALYKQVKSDKLTPVITPDGPKGPRFEFKGGALALAQLCSVPVVPVAYAAQGAKVMKTWDKFILPKPFSRIVIMVGEPYLPPRKTTAEEAQALQQAMAERLHATYRQAATELGRRGI